MFVLNRCRGTPADTPTGPSRHRLFPMGNYPTAHTQGTPVRRSGRRSGGFHYGGLLAQVGWRKTVPARSEEERVRRGAQGGEPAPPEPPGRQDRRRGPARGAAGKERIGTGAGHGSQEVQGDTVLSTTDQKIPCRPCGGHRVVMEFGCVVLCGYRDGRDSTVHAADRRGLFSVLNRG